MHTSFVKAAASVLVLLAAWVDNNLSPLFWVLVVLAGLDILLHARDKENHYKKLLSISVALGLPAFLASHLSTDLFRPEVLKVVVALLTLAYVQIVIPDMAKVVKKLLPSQDAPLVDMGAKATEAAIEQKAQAQEQQK